MITLANHVWAMCSAAVLFLGPVPLSVAIAAYRARAGQCGIAHFCLSTLVLWCVIQTSVGILLGWTHEFNLRGMITAELIVMAAGFVVLTFSRPHLGLLSGDVAFSKQPLDVGERLVVAAAGFAGLALFRHLLQDPIEDFDSLAWHLPTMTTWYQSGFLTIPPEGVFQGYPFSWEVLCTLFLLPFGDDSVVALPNLLAWIIFGLAVYLLSGAIGVNRLSSMTAATLVLLLPIMKLHVNSLHVDLPLGAFFLSGLYFMLSYLERRSSIDLFLFIAVIGMVCGIKTSGLIYAGMLLCPIALARLIPGDGLPDGLVRKPGVAWAAGIGTALLVGGFWYIRNFIETGNPLRFVTVRIGDVTLFQGILDTEFIHRTTLAFLFDVMKLGHWKILGSQILGYLGPPFLMLVVAVLLLPIAFMKEERRISRIYYGGVVGLVFVTGFLFWHTPYSGDDDLNRGDITPWIGGQFRYGFPFIGLVALMASIGLGTFPQAKKYWIGAVLMIAAIFVGYGLVLYAFIGTLVVIGIVAHFGVVGMGVPQRFLRNRRIISMGMILLVGMSVWLGYVTRERRAEQREVVYGGSEQYLREHVGLDETIGYVAVGHLYPLYGRELNRKVLYAKALTDDLQEWVALLRAQEVAVVAVGPLLQGGLGGDGKKEFAWLQLEGNAFERVLGSDILRETVFYRVRR